MKIYTLIQAVVLRIEVGIPASAGGTRLKPDCWRGQIDTARVAGVVTGLLLLCMASQQAWAQCSILLKPTVSGCYSVSGASKATVSVEVAWKNATISPTVNDASDAITVNYAGLTRTINPGSYTTVGSHGTIVSPQVVAFDVSLSTTASGQRVSAVFSNASSCSVVSEDITLPAPCTPTTCPVGQVGGQVFNDFNADGVKDAGETSGVPGAVVKAYDCTGTLVGTATTDAYGLYSFTGLTAGNYPLRVEFSNLPAYAGMGTVHGTGGHSTVQFVNATDCTVDVGVSNPNDYCQTTPKVIIPCYVTGDPLFSGTATSGTDPVLVGFAYGRFGGVSKGIPAVTDNDHYANASQAGSLWSVAYNKFTRNAYASATLKRHVGLGPLGLGGIYVTDMTTGTTANYVDVTVAPLNINVGQSLVPSNAARGLGSKDAPSADSLSFALIGKVGIGGMDITEDGHYLFFTNLFDNKIYKLDITTPSPTLAGSYAIPNPGCVNGLYRPYALKVKRNSVYVGAVCDGTATASRSDMRAYVYAFNQTSSTFATTPIFDFLLTYPRGKVDSETNTGWFPWTDRFDDLVVGNKLIHPQPIFVDLDFDVDGSMVLGLGDRTGVQGGSNNYRPNGTGSYSAYAGGDILRAANLNGVFVLENNGKVGGITGWGANNNEGPGFGEFYHDGWADFLFGGDYPVHSENTMGGLAIRPGSGQTISSEMDPVYSRFGGSTYSGGIRYLSNTTGDFPQDATSGLVLYRGFLSNGILGKATGLGDIEIACDVPTYLEIGNRVWFDSDQDGIQDACEPPLAGVNVSLYQGNTFIATTTTNANGEYYFNNNPVSSTVAGTTSSTLMQPNTAYQIVFGTGQFANGNLTVGGGSYQPTQAFSTAPTANTLNDSNAALATVAGASVPTASVTTGGLGRVNHTIDAGFICLPIRLTATTSGSSVCLGSPVTLTAQVSQAGSYSYVWSAPAGVTLTGANTATVTTSGLNTTGVNTFTVTVRTGPACFTTATVSVMVNPMPTIITRAVCNGLSTYDVSFTATAGATITASAGTIVGNQVTGIPSGQTLTLTATLNGCSVSSQATQDCQRNAASLGDFVFLDTNRNGMQDSGELGIGGVTVTLYLNGVVSATTVTNTSGLYSFTGLTPGNSNSYVVGFTAPAGYSATLQHTGSDATKDSDADISTGRTQSVTLAPGENNPTLDAGYYPATPKLDLQKYVSKSVAQQGDTLLYKVTLMNVGSGAATNIVVRDSTSGVTYLPGSISAPAGTTYTQGLPISRWSVSSISAGQSLTLTYRVIVDSSGVIYNTAMVPGIELPEVSAKVCTSVPIKMCVGDTFTLAVPPGRASYNWYRNGVLIVGQATNTLTVTLPGSYSLSLSGTSAGSQCPDFSCCPAIFELDSLPVFQAAVIPATCLGSTPQTNGRLALTGFNPAFRYQYSAGATFNPAASLSGPPQRLPANGVLATNLASSVKSLTYTIRVYNTSGCYRDQTVLLQPTICGCPVDVCAPFVIQQSKRGRRIGDPVR